MPVIGEDALAGVGITFPIIVIISAFTLLVGVGGAPLAGIKLGERKNDEARNIMMTSFFMLVIVGTILIIVLLIFDRQLLY